MKIYLAAVADEGDDMNIIFSEYKTTFYGAYEAIKKYLLVLHRDVVARVGVAEPEEFDLRTNDVKEWICRWGIFGTDDRLFTLCIEEIEVTE